MCETLYLYATIEYADERDGKSLFRRAFFPTPLVLRAVYSRGISRE
jgi:hypothetical protein